MQVKNANTNQPYNNKDKVINKDTQFNVLNAEFTQ